MTGTGETEASSSHICDKKKKCLSLFENGPESHLLDETRWCCCGDRALWARQMEVALDLFAKLGHSFSSQ